MDLGFLTSSSRGMTDTLLSYLSQPTNKSFGGADPFSQDSGDFLSQLLPRPRTGTPSIFDLSKSLFPKTYANPSAGLPPQSLPQGAPTGQLPPGISTQGMTLPPPTMQYPITSKFDERGPWWTNGHKGVDLGIPQNTPIPAADGGIVLRAGHDKELGNYVTVQHSWGISTYGHLSYTTVTPGEQVGPETIIGLTGSTGVSTGPHLHFQTEVGGVPTDPLALLQSRGLQFLGTPRPPVKNETLQDELLNLIVGVAGQE